MPTQSTINTIGHLGPHDLGGLLNSPVSTPTQDERHVEKGEEHKLVLWEKRIDAIVSLMMFTSPTSSSASAPASASSGSDAAPPSAKPKPLFNVHMLRKEIESLDPQVYHTASYYERWLICTINIFLKHALFTRQELQEMYQKVLPLASASPSPSSEGGGGGKGRKVEEEGGDKKGGEEGEGGKVGGKGRLQVGDQVRVRRLTSDGEGEEVALQATKLLSPTTKLHRRTPGYIQGKVGTIELYVEAFDNPTLMSLGLKGPKQPLYRVRFRQKDVWGDEDYEGTESDTLDVDLYGNWLEKVNEEEEDEGREKKRARVGKEEEEEEHHHKHEHEHGGHSHTHSKREETEHIACAKEPPLTSNDILTQTLLDLLTEKGYLTASQVQQQISRMDSVGETLAGADLIVEAWKDDAFKALLLAQPEEACRRLGLNPGYTKLHVIENTPEVHNVIVCTLCSCYPRSLLGIPPDWYKSYRYRSRVVIEPRKVLKEFGLELPADVRVQAHDSTADLRYLILPLRPAGCNPKEAKWSKQELKTIVTRDCLIGVAQPQIRDQTFP